MWHIQIQLYVQFYYDIAAPYLRRDDGLGEVLVDSVDEFLPGGEVQDGPVPPVHHPAQRVQPMVNVQAPPLHICRPARRNQRRHPISLVTLKEA